MPAAFATGTQTRLCDNTLNGDLEDLKGAEELRIRVLQPVADGRLRALEGKPASDENIVLRRGHLLQAEKAPLIQMIQ